MLRLDQLYFRNFFILFFITLLITAISGYFLLKKIEINNHKTMLTNMINQFELIDSSKIIMHPFFQTTKSDFLIPPTYDTCCKSFAPLESRLLTA
jgi:hypothetical protein